MSYVERAKEFIKKNEGLRLAVYKCTAGYPTIGYGHKLEKHELGVTHITRDMAERQFDKDFSRVHLQAAGLGCWHVVGDNARIVLLDMCFNLGLAGLVKFQKMLAALERKDFTLAARELMDSLYARQVGSRAAKNFVLLTSDHQPYA